jgi:hypothetical protein
LRLLVALNGPKAGFGILDFEALAGLNDCVSNNLLSGLEVIELHPNGERWVTGDGITH